MPPEGDDLRIRERGAEGVEGKDADIGVAPQEREGKGVADKDGSGAHGAKDIRGLARHPGRGGPRTSPAGMPQNQNMGGG